MQGVCALVGILVRLAFGDSALWVASALSMSLAGLAMQLSSTTHPPGGATALIAWYVPKSFSVAAVVELRAGGNVT